MKTSLITTCMNRGLFLQDSVANWLMFDQFDEIIITDWSSAQPVKNMLNKFKDERIKVLRVDGQKFFNLCIARNIALEYCKNDWIVATDSDVTFARGFFDSFLPSKFIIYRGGKANEKGTTGTVFMHKFVVTVTCGYNELMWGYGGDDDDFYRRIRKFEEFKIYPFLAGALYHRNHSDSERLEFKKGKHGTLRDSYWRENRQLPQWNCASLRHLITYEVYQYLKTKGVVNYGKKTR